MDKMTKLNFSVPVVLGEVEAVFPAHGIQGGDDGAGWTQTGQHSPHRRLTNFEGAPSLRLRIVLIDGAWRKPRNSESHTIKEEREGN